MPTSRVPNTENYWEMYPVGIDICQSCHLEWCIYDKESPEGAVCPAGFKTDKELGQRVTNNKESKAEKTRKIVEKIMEHIVPLLPLPVQELGKQSGLAPNLIHSWLHGKYLVGETENHTTTVIGLGSKTESYLTDLEKIEYNDTRSSNG